VACIPPTLDGWVYIIPIHGPLDGPLYTRAQYTPTIRDSTWHVRYPLVTTRTKIELVDILGNYSTGLE